MTTTSSRFLVKLARSLAARFTSKSTTALPKTPSPASAPPTHLAPSPSISTTLRRLSTAAVFPDWLVPWKEEDISNRRELLVKENVTPQTAMERKNPIVGFIGYGNMAEAIMRGMVQGFVTPASNIHVCDHNEGRRALAKDIGCNVYTNANAVVKAADVVLICVKPKDAEAVLKEIASAAGTSTVIVSVCAGITISKIQKCLAKNARIIRVMPNTPCLVREGASSITGDKDATEEDMDLVETIMSSLGVCVRVEEPLIDAIVGVSGSGPAYVYMMIEAMADGGVLCGLSRPDATRLAAQTLIGGARMVLESGRHPGQLKDEVCSPNGTTIRAVHALEQAGLRSALIDAVVASKTRSEELGRK